MEMLTEWDCWNCGYHYDQSKEPAREQATTGRVLVPNAPPIIPCITCPRCRVCMGCVKATDATSSGEVEQEPRIGFTQQEAVIIADALRCTACGCEIPPGKAGRMCVECRTIGPPRFATLQTGQQVPIKRGEVVKAGDLLVFEDGQLAVAKKAEPTGFVWPGGDTATIDVGQLR